MVGVSTSRPSIGPGWFTTVMGTGIVAVALATLPFPLPGAQGAALAVWLLAVALLVAVTTAFVVDVRRHPGALRAHLDDPAAAPAYGAPAMAVMTVGAGAVLVGHRVVGPTAALALDAVLWSVGTLLGLAAAVVVPVRMVTTDAAGPEDASGAWLMPVVPPMVSAATGALLVPRLPAGQPQQTMLLLCYAFFGLALAASAVTVAVLWLRLLRHGPGAPAAAPTLWIVLGPLGQSITAAHHLGVLAPDVLGPGAGDAFAALVLVHGVPTLGVALLWLALAATLTVRAARAGLPFTLAWWSFTFPVGTLVTGVAGLASATGLVALQVLTAVLLAGLVAAWVVVLGRTAALVLRSVDSSWLAVRVGFPVSASSVRYRRARRTT